MSFKDFIYIYSSFGLYFFIFKKLEKLELARGCVQKSSKARAFQISQFSAALIQTNGVCTIIYNCDYKLTSAVCVNMCMCVLR